MINIENKEYSVIKITITENLTLDELKKILGVLTRVFHTKKHFAFYVHCTLTEVPSEITQLTKYLIGWMKESHSDLLSYLEGSSIIIKSDAVVAVLNGVFKIQPTVKPNCVTTNYKLGEEFVVDIMKNYLKRS